MSPIVPVHLVISLMVHHHTDKYNVQGVSDLYSLKESKLKKETARAAQFSKVSEVSVDTLLEKEFYTKMGWREEVWDFAPLKEGKTPVLKNGDSNMTTMLEMKEISSVEELAEDERRSFGCLLFNSGY